MIRTTKLYRIRYDTYKKIKRVFPSKRNESAADYFERLAEEIAK
jgi:hypothetical protein